MKHLKFFLPIILLCAGVSPTSASSGPSPESVLAQLSPATTDADSLKVLFDAYDLSTKETKKSTAWKILRLAERTANYEVLFEMLPQISAMELKNPEKQETLLEVASKLPEGDRKKSVETFIEIEKAAYAGAFATPEERQKVLYDYLKEDITPKENPYDNFLDLYRVVIFLGQSAKGNMYMEYLVRLEQLLNTLPDHNNSISNLYYTTASNFYTNNGFPQQAVDTDKKLLEIISQLEKKYAKAGRKYRNYDRYKYICYRRMLSNYEALKPHEIAAYYQKCLDLVGKNEEVAESYHDTGRTESYYLMANHQYGRAIPKLQEALSKTDNRNTRRRLLAMLTQAADSIDNEAVLSDALKEYNRLLQESQKLRAEEALVELQMRYDVKELTQAKEEAVDEMHKMQISTGEKLISIALFAVFVLAVIVMLLYRSRFRLIHKSRDITAENLKLRQKIEELLCKKEIPGTQDLKKK